MGMVRIAEKLTELGIPTPNQFRKINELKEQEFAIRKRYEHYWPEMENLTKLEQNIAVVKEAIEEELFDVRFQPNDDTITENIAFVKVHDEKHLRSDSHRE